MPSIVTSSLQLYLIASDTGSYSGSGTTWTDLSPNAYNTTLVGSPTFNTTHFNFSSGVQYVDTNQSLSSETFSVGVWFRTSASGIKMLVSKETAPTLRCERYQEIHLDFTIKASVGLLMRSVT